MLSDLRRPGATGLGVKTQILRIRPTVIPKMSDDVKCTIKFIPSQTEVSPVFITMLTRGRVAGEG